MRWASLIPHQSGLRHEHAQSEVAAVAERNRATNRIGKGKAETEDPGAGFVAAASETFATELQPSGEVATEVCATAARAKQGSISTLAATGENCSRRASSSRISRRSSRTGGFCSAVWISGFGSRDLQVAWRYERRAGDPRFGFGENRRVSRFHVEPTEISRFADAEQYELQVVALLAPHTGRSQPAEGEFIFGVESVWSKDRQV